MVTVTQDSMSVEELGESIKLLHFIAHLFYFFHTESLLRDTDHNGFPVVVSQESQYLVGFVFRKDLTIAISIYSYVLKTISCYFYLVNLKMC